MSLLEKTAVASTNLRADAHGRAIVRRPAVPVGDYSCVHRLVELQAALVPKAIAVSLEGERLTYEQLNSQANKLARHMLRLGLRPEALVAVSMERSTQMIVTLLAVLKAGAAYVPLDPGYPKERLAFMLQDSRAQIILTTASLVKDLPPHGARVISIDADSAALSSESTSNLPDRADGNNLAYVIYTSGSTGQPKGVAIEHHSLMNFVASSIIQYELSPADRILQFASISFDASVEEIFCSLASGATLVLRTNSMLDSVPNFLEKCDESAITVLDLPTAYWHELAWTLATHESTLPSSVRLVIIGGERAIPERLSLWRGSVGSRVRLINTYGPTETTIVATTCDLSSPDIAVDGEVPIGVPIQNVQAYILDELGAQVPAGVRGELYLGGEGLARGYLNQPELTDEKFIPNRFRPKAGDRLYRTGDLARRRSDGLIEYLGRVDDQVKINGFRIELGEIESALRACSLVHDVVVIAREDSPGARRIVAYVIPRPDVHIDKSLSSDLRQWLSDTLPAHMIPFAFVEMDELPLTPGGKIDRKALPRPNRASKSEQEHYVRPRDPLEYQLVQIWEDVLDVRPLGIRDNFFETGGQSLLAVRLLSEIERIYGKRLSLASLFAGATIEDQARALLKEAPGAEHSLLVEIQQGGARTPFFFLHGDFNGGGFYCRNLARYLGPDRPFVVLQPHGIDGQQVPKTIQAMAADHVGTLRAFKPNGPYLLGGFCNGALVAFEMARQLHAQGQQIERLVLMLASASNSRFGFLEDFIRLIGRYSDHNTDDPMERFIRLRQQLIRLRDITRGYVAGVSALARMTTRQRIRKLGSKAHRELKRLARRVDSHAKHAELSGGTAADGSVAAGPPDSTQAPALSTQHSELSTTLDRRGELLQAYDRAMLAYVPRFFPGRLTLFWAQEEPSDTPGDPTMGWGNVAGEVEVHIVPGRHLTTITKHIGALAERLNDVLSYSA
jgi:amino acid adenylation domain-containing protein